MKKSIKKILIYTDVNFFAGCENVLENIVNYPSINDKYNLIYAYRRSKKYTDDLKSRNINAHFIPLLLLTPDSILSRVDRKNKVLYLLLKIAVRIPEKLQIFNAFNLIIQLIVLYLEKPDIVHINNGGYPGSDSCRIMAIAAGLSKIKKIIFTINNMAVPRNHILDKYLDSLVNKNVDYFVTASRAAAEELINVRGIGKGKIKSIPNTLSFDNIRCEINSALRQEFDVDKDSLVIGSAGLLIERKGYDVLIKALSFLPKEKNWCSYIFGEGDQRELLQGLIDEYHLQDRVFLPGFRSDVLNYVCDFDIFIMPSVRNEDMPNAINEAMLLGKPIIGTKISGIPEQVDDGVNGYLVVPGDSKDLASKISKLITLKHEKLSEMGQQSKEKYMSSFSYKLSMDQYLDLYEI
jgi:glycosyltransferase involved in cell wall biosynthesis